MTKAGASGHGVVHRPRRRAVSPDEARIWQSVTRDVTPLPGKSADNPPEVTAPAPVAPPSPETIRPRAIAPLPAAPKRELPQLSPQDSPAGLDKRSAERMKKGEMVIEGRLDLHGMTQDPAHSALNSFILRAWDSGRRCVLVITGKGGRPGPGVLKSQVPRWLNQSPLRERIIGFSHARPKDGGDGALYVLIRRRR